MAVRRDGVWAVRTGVLSLAVALAAGAAAPAAVAAVEDFTGTYTGSWNNTTFLSTGAASLVTAIEGAQFVATVDMDGNVYGQPDPPPIEIAGLVSGGDAVFSMVSAGGYGTIDGTIDGDTGQIAFSITGLLAAGIAEVTATGSFGDGSALALDYAVTFAGPPGPPAVGTLNVVRAPEPADRFAAAAAALAALGGRARRRRAAA
jgi:hypothetical protein